MNVSFTLLIFPQRGSHDRVAVVVGGSHQPLDFILNSGLMGKLFQDLFLLASENRVAV